MSDDEPWEPVARETLWQALHCTRDDVEATIESVSNTVYFDHDVDEEQIERMRQAVADLEYATEAYLAELCDETEPWSDDGNRTPSWQPLDEDDRSESSESL